LLQWTRLSLEQRNLARTQFREWQALPTSERQKIEQRWDQWLAAKAEHDGIGTTGPSCERSWPVVNDI